METNWIQDEILRGLQKLLALSLERTPAGELLPITVGAWVEAIMRGRAFDEALDVPRFRSAFVTMAEHRRTWPTPADFLAALPDRETFKALPAKTPAPEEAARVIAEIRAKLGLTK